MDYYQCLVASEVVTPAEGESVVVTPGVLGSTEPTSPEHRVGARVGARHRKPYKEC